jgi:DNA-binding MarR family transcriptional regulator
LSTTRTIRESLHRKSLASARQRAALGRVLGLSDTEVLAVQHLARAGRMTPGELGRQLQLTSGGTTALVQRLERAGHLVREPHPTDRRSVLVRLTPEISRRASKSVAPLVAEVERLAAALPKDQRAVVARFLADVADAGERHADALARTAAEGERDVSPLELPALWA